MFGAYRPRKKETGFPYRDYLDRHRCIFIHVPRAAGTSILQAMGKRDEGAG